MATAIKYLEFTITLTNKSQVDTLAAAYPGGIRIAPDAAALAYLAPIQYTTDPWSVPNIRSPYLILGSNYPRNVAEFEKKSGGWFGLSFLFGNTTKYRWIGKFVYAAGTTAEIGGTPTEVVAIAQRRAMMSFDAFGNIEDASGGIADFSVSKAASRHSDGMGLAVRIESSSHEATLNATANGAPATNKSWERFYIRVRRAPSLGLARFFRVKLAGGASRGFSLDLTTDLRITFKNIQDGGGEIAYNSTTDQLELNRWYRIDVVWKSGATGTNQTRVYIGRKLVMTQVITASGGINTNSNHETSHLGSFAGWESGDTAEYDIDDWVMADWPTEDSGGRFVGKDWLNGSRVKMIPLSAMGPGNAWTGTGDHRTLNANVQNTSAVDATANFASNVSGAALVGTANALDITGVKGAIGAVAFYVAAHLRQQVAGAGTIGWRFNGLLDLAALATQSTNYRWERRLYRPSGLTDPIANLTPLELHHIKAANTNNANCQALVAIVELIGTFGQEDVPVDSEEDDNPPAIPPRRGLHNAPYPQSPWANGTLPVQSPVVVHSGQYTGNGTITELIFRSNVNWLFIRRTAAVAGNFWFSSGQGGHFEGQPTVLPGVHALIDPSFTPSGLDDTQEQRCVVRLVGDNIAWNQNAAVYEYVAVMDPGSRFMLNDLFTHQTGLTSAENPLQKQAFTPEYSFFQREHTSSGTYFRWIKGIGHAAPNGQILNIAESNTVAQHATGLLTSLVDLHLSGGNQPHISSSWRRDDLSTDPNRFKVVKIGSYVGNGTASRTIGFENATGLRPLFAIVSPHNGLSYYRDPSNLTNTSNAMGTGTSSTTAITGGGIDSFDVGSTLNSNGIVYEYFVLLGSSTAGNGGWSIDGEFAYVDPDWVQDPGEDDPDDAIEPIEDEPDEPDPDDPGDNECDAGEVCVTITTRLVNEALLEIGSTKVLTNYCTQETIEAQTARILYEQSVRATLHAFPWPFATKYAALVLTATQPTNEDWDYAYRQPSDCVFERRISVDREGAVNPTPPPFELSSDANGGIIFTNEPNAVLEYTMRPACVAFTGDALFREALKWHLAAAMAPPLTRIAEKAKFCREQFDLCIARANAIIRPGDPGLRSTPAWQANDAGAGAMAANAEVANLGLLRIGASTIANLTTDQSREATAVNLIFEHELRATLRDFPWKFAKRYNDALVLVGGTATVPVNVDWQYSYRLPTDYVSVRRLVTEGTGRSFERYPKTFEVGTDATGALLFTGQDAPNLEYTARIANAVLRSDELFREALAWRIAAALAPSLAQTDPEVQEQIGRGPEHPPDNTQRVSHKPNKAAMRERAQRWAFSMYLRALEKARVADANEAEPEPHGDAEWIEGRN